MHRFYFGNFNNSNFDMALRFFWQVMLAMCVVGLLIGAMFLVFQGIGMHRMAKRKGIAHGWMGFVPVLNFYLLGKLSNMPDRRRRSEVAMLVLAILSTIFSIVVLSYIVPIFDFAIRASFLNRTADIADMPEFIGIFAMMMISALVALGLSIALMILMFTALHRVYKQFSPANASVMTVFTVIALVIFGIPIYPFILFAIRNNEIWPMGKPHAGYNGPSYPPNIPKYTPSKDYNYVPQTQSYSYTNAQPPNAVQPEPVQHAPDVSAPEQAAEFNHASDNSSQNTYTTHDGGAPSAPMPDITPPPQVTTDSLASMELPIIEPPTAPEYQPPTQSEPLKQPEPPEPPQSNL